MFNIDPSFPRRYTKGDPLRIVFQQDPRTSEHNVLNRDHQVIFEIVIHSLRPVEKLVEKALKEDLIVDVPRPLQYSLRLFDESAVLPVQVARYRTFEPYGDLIFLLKSIKDH